MTKPTTNFPSFQLTKYQRIALEAARAKVGKNGGYVWVGGLNIPRSTVKALAARGLVECAEGAGASFKITAAGLELLTTSVGL